MSEKKILQHFRAKRKFSVDTEGERRYVLNIAKKRNFWITTRKDEKGGFKVLYLWKQ